MKNKIKSIKKKSGRPSHFDGKIMETVKAVWPEAKTARALNNKYYLFCAMQALKGFEKKVDWLFGGIQNPTSELATHKTTILTELGRLKDKSLIKDCAMQICELKPTAQKAVSILKQLRTGKTIDEKTPLEQAKQAFTKLTLPEKKMFINWQKGKTSQTLF